MESFLTTENENIIFDFISFQYMQFMTTFIFSGAIITVTGKRAFLLFKFHKFNFKIPNVCAGIFTMKTVKVCYFIQEIQKHY